MKYLALISSLLIISCGPKGGAMNQGSPSDSELCQMAVDPITTFEGCGITIYQTDQGILVAGTGFRLPSFSGLSGGPVGQCVLLTNGEALRGNLGQPDYCEVMISNGALTAIADSTGFTYLLGR